MSLNTFKAPLIVKHKTEIFTSYVRRNNFHPGYGEAFKLMSSNVSNCFVCYSPGFPICFKVNISYTQFNTKFISNTFSSFKKATRKFTVKCRIMSAAKPKYSKRSLYSKSWKHSRAGLYPFCTLHVVSQLLKRAKIFNNFHNLHFRRFI